MKQSVFRKAFLASIPVCTGYLAIGTAFGVMFRDAGYGVGWAAFMSIIVFAGSMQFVAVGLLSSGTSLLSIALTALLVNGRHLIYGLSMLEKYRNAGPAKPYLIFGLSDETFSLVSSTGNDLPPKQRTRYCFWITLLDQCYWVIGSIFGSLVGMILPFSTEGVDFALTALFITIVVDQWHSCAKHLPAILGCASALVCLVIFGTDNFLIPTMFLMVALLMVMRSRIEEVSVQ